MNQDQLYKSLNSAYNPQRQSIATQQAALPGFYNAQRTGLEQARTNAFKDITNQANTRGGYFSGFSPDAQAQYTGATYIPAMGNIANAQTTANQALIDALNSVNTQQMTQASGLFQTAQDRAQQQKQWEQEQAASQAQFNAEIAEKQRQFNAELAASQSSGGGGSSSGGSSGGSYGGGGGSTTTKPITYTNEVINGILDQMFSGYNPGANDSYTENTVLPYLQSLGISLPKASELTYNYRKNIFGE